MDVLDLLEHDLGHDKAGDLDSSPPMPLLMTLAQRSGIELDRLRGMSLDGWTPWLFDSLDMVPSALETYVFQLSVLLPVRSRKAHLISSITSWRAWLPIQPIKRACPLCLRDPVDHPILLAWMLPLMLSCPLHGCWLEPYWGLPGYFLGWEHDPCTPREASELISAMDRRTWQALTTGFVELPRRRVHAGVWFRLLRTLLDEVNTPISHCGSYGWNIRHIWERCDQSLRAGQSQWHPYEILPLAVQLQMLEATATAIHMVESGILSFGGAEAYLFQPEPQIEVPNGLQSNDAGLPGNSNRWWEVSKAIDEAIAAAKHDAEAARTLFWLASYGRHDAASLEELRVMFADLHIPPEFLSHYTPGDPFSWLKLNNGLSDKF